MSTQIAHGETAVGLLFDGVTAPHFGRGAVKSVRVHFDGYEGEFYLCGGEQQRGGDLRVLATTTNQELVCERDVPLEERLASFAKTQLPYAQHDVGAAQGYLNFGAYPRLEWKLVTDEVNESDAYATATQTWSQLLSEDGSEPVVRFPFNLVQEKPYMPPPQQQPHDENNKEN